MKHTRKAPVLVLAALTVLAGVLASAVSAAGKHRTVSVIATGLNNPRGLAFVGGRLYVAEAGTAGTDCPKGAVGPTGGPLCEGRTSDLAWVSGGKVHRLVTGLISNSDTGPVATEGLEAVAPAKGGLRVVFGESTLGILASGAPAQSYSSADRHQWGRLDTVVGKQLKPISDVGDVDFKWSKTHKSLVPKQFPDSNPNALLQIGRTSYVVNAASNTLDTLNAKGRIVRRAFFPNSGKSDAVPTCVAKGPGGNLYVGQLAPGAAKNKGVIFRYHIATHKVSVWQRGFNVVDGCGFDKAGNFYAVEFQATGFNPGPTGNPAGAVIEISPSGKRTVLGAGKLDYPQGFATDSKGNVYVSNWSIMPGTPSSPGAPTGQIVRISP
jgi:hypothetical protein